MNQNTQPISQTPPPPKQVSPILTWVLLFILGMAVGLMIDKTTLLSALRIPYLGVTPTPILLPTPPPTQSPNPIIIQAKSLSDSTIITGWKHYKNERFSIEIPSNWNIFDLSNQKTYYGDIPTVNLLITDSMSDPRYDKTAASTGTSNTVGISLSAMYFDKKWSDLTSLNTFFDVQTNLWTDIMRRSGGGALLQTTIQLDQLADIQTAKRTNTWTQAMENVDSTDTDFFFPDSKSGGDLLVWNIHYRLPLKGSDITERKKIITQILSTFKFIQNAPMDTSTWKIYTTSKGDFSFKYPANLSPIELFVNDPHFYNTHDEAIASASCITNRAGTLLNPCGMGLLAVYPTRIETSKLDSTDKRIAYSYIDNQHRTWTVVRPVYGEGGTSTRAEITSDHIYHIDISIYDSFMEGQTNEDIQKQIEFINQLLSTVTFTQ